MSLLSRTLELNNLRLAFGAVGLAGDLRDELRDDSDFAKVVARTLLLPAFARDRRGPSAAQIFPAFARRPIPALEGKRIGILASGGAGATASLIGVQRALEEAGLVPAAISACSGAALFGSLWAAGLSADEVASFWLGLRDRDYLDPDWPALARAAVRRFRGWGGLLRGDAIERSFRERLHPGRQKLGQTAVPFSTVVWNIDHNRVEYFGTRQTPDLDLARAARVAVSIPVLVGPVRVGEHMYGDGGIVDIFPAAPLLDEDPPLDLVLGINCYYGDDFFGEDVAGFLDQPWSIMKASGQLRWSSHLELARERMRALGSRLTLLHPVPYEETRGAAFYRNFLDRGAWPRAMRLGYDATRAALERWGDARPRPTPIRALRVEPMGPVDLAWLRMETADNPMTITSIMLFDRPLDHEGLVRVVDDALAQNPRLGQRLDESDPERVSWRPVTRVELGDHIERVRLASPDSEVELRALASRLASVPLDRSRPLWHLQHVEGYRGGSALVIRLHHAIGDGAALLKVLTSLAGPDAPAFSSAAAGPVLRPHDLGRHKKEVVRAIKHLVAQPDDRPTSLRGPLGLDKRVAWSPAIPLPYLQALAHAADATTNDVVLSALAGALRGLLLERGERTSGTTLHAIVPVNLRGGESELGNRFGLVFAPLPVGTADPAARLAAVSREMRQIKRSPEAAVALLTLAALGSVSPPLHRAAVRFFGRKATVVVTNVPGPKEPLSLAGVPVTGLISLVPQSARLGLGASILSYAGKVRLGVAADAGLCDRPEQLVAAFVEELRALEEGRVVLPARHAFALGAAVHAPGTRGTPLASTAAER